MLVKFEFNHNEVNLLDESRFSNFNFENTSIKKLNFSDLENWSLSNLNKVLELINSDLFIEINFIFRKWNESLSFILRNIKNKKYYFKFNNFDDYDFSIVDFLNFIVEDNSFTFIEMKNLFFMILDTILKKSKSYFYDVFGNKRSMFREIYASNSKILQKMIVDYIYEESQGRE